MFVACRGMRKMKSFNEVFEDKTKYGTKIKTSEYCEMGAHLIIDQGQEQVAGYTDIEEGVFEEVPVIIFGDHTRVIKYVDKPFFLGADGVKVLRSKFKNANYKYLYYALKNARIPNTGYNRHFKWLKEVQIEYPDYRRQENVVKILDKVSDLIETRQHEIKRLDDLIKARFVELFGNPVLNEKGWESNLLAQLTLKIGSGATPKGGREAYQEEGIALIRSMNVYNGKFEYKDLAHISDEQAAKLDNVIIKESDVLLNITGASVARSCVVPNQILPARVNQHVCIIRCKECIEPIFLNRLLIDDNYQKLLWEIAGSGATREAITKQQVERLKIILPPIELQNQFADFVRQVDKSKVAVQKALDETQTLFDSLMQEYFG